ncbi:hypothetical protein AAG906_020685 [Vitis piasezkii]
MRLRRVIWNPWKSNGKLKNMKNQSFEVLCHKEIWNARRGIMSATFGALPEVHFLHSIYHFKAQELKRRSYSHCKQITPSCFCTAAKSAFCCENFAAFLHSAMEFLLKLPDICATLEAEHLKMKANFAALRNSQHLVSFWTPRRHPLVISCELLMGNPRLKITLNGAPAGHESAETPIGHESDDLGGETNHLYTLSLV